MYHVVGPWIFSIGLPHLEPDDHVPSTQISPEAFFFLSRGLQERMVFATIPRVGKVASVAES